MPRPDWSRPLPRPLLIPDVMTLATLADVRELLRHVPKERRTLDTWRQVAASSRPRLWMTAIRRRSRWRCASSCSWSAVSACRRDAAPFPPPWDRHRRPCAQGSLAAATLAHGQTLLLVEPIKLLGAQLDALALEHQTPDADCVAISSPVHQFIETALPILMHLCQRFWLARRDVIV